MSKIFKLHNQIKHYEWGSAQILPEFLNQENLKGLPFAEMWMGTHKGGSSKVQLDDNGSLTELSEVSGDLPFLFKILAVEKPLSIQAHPDKTQAEEGFKKEEKSGLSIKSPKRNYKDTNHKPEIICALTPIKLMAGFREPQTIKKLFNDYIFVLPQLKEILTPVINSLARGQLTDFFRALFNLSGYERDYLSSIINNYESKIQSGSISDEEWNLIKYFCSVYPGDPASLSPLYLNYIELKPGQAIFVPAGILHAYISGFAVELMSNSDNVLRGGLTPKHVDISELLNILRFEPFIPQVITPSESADWFCYNTQCSNEFELACMSKEQKFPGNTPAMCIVTEGEVKVDDKTFKKGESFFIPKIDVSNDSAAENADVPFFGGDFKLYAACSPCQK